MRNEPTCSPCSMHLTRKTLRPDFRLHGLVKELLPALSPDCELYGRPDACKSLLLQTSLGTIANRSKLGYLPCSLARPNAVQIAIAAYSPFSCAQGTSESSNKPRDIFKEPPPAGLPGYNASCTFRRPTHSSDLARTCSSAASILSIQSCAWW